MQGAHCTADKIHRPLQIVVAKGVKIHHSRAIARNKIYKLDNIAKIVLDALNGVAWSDDKCVVDLHVAKYYASVPGVQITIRWYRAWRRKC